MIQTSYKYEQLTEVLRKEIVGGKFPDGRFYSVKSMMERFLVSQATLTKALEPLYDAGLIYSVSGKGTFVAKDVTVREPKKAAPPTVYCIAAYEEMFDPAHTSPDWCFTQLMLKGVMAAARKHNMQVNIAPMSTNLESFQCLAERENAMFIFLNFDHCEQLVEYAIKNKIPYSLYINAPVSRKMNLVYCDVGKATEDAVEYLVKAGHRDIMFVGDYAESVRHRGLKRALRKAGLPYHEKYNCFFYRGLVETSRAEVAAKLSICPEVTAILASTDLRAIGAWQAAQDLSRDCAVVGIDNMWQFYNFPTAITSVDMHLEAAGEALFDSLLHKWQQGEDRQITINHTLDKGVTA